MRISLSGAAGIAALGGYGRWIEPSRVSVSRHVIGDATAWPALRLVQITDLHLKGVGRREERVAEHIHDLAPDVLLFTGDAVDERDNLHLLDAFLSLLPRTAHSVAVPGNWEHWARIDFKELEDLYGRHEIRLLVNETVTLEHHGRAYSITGLDDATGGKPDLSAALETVGPGRNHIVLAHSPIYRDYLASRLSSGEHAPQAVLSGHTHGGQVQVFGWAPARPPGSGRYVSGWYKESKPHLFVSRGIGTSVFPVRVGASPELPCFEWYLE